MGLVLNPDPKYEALGLDLVPVHPRQNSNPYPQVKAKQDVPTKQGP